MHGDVGHHSLGAPAGRLGLRDEDGLGYDADPGDDAGGVGVDVRNERSVLIPRHGVKTQWPQARNPRATSASTSTGCPPPWITSNFVRLGATVGCLGLGDEQGLCWDTGRMDVDVEEGGVGVPRHEGAVAAVHEGHRQHQHDVLHHGLHCTIVK